MEIQVTAYPAKNGESLLIECIGDKNTNILVDLGFPETYTDFIKSDLERIAINGGKLDLLVLTHFDSDHISGAIKFFEDLLLDRFIEIDEIWVNDFVALCSSEIEQDICNTEEKEVYDFSKFILMKYGKGKSVRNTLEISKSEIMDITKLINKLGLNDKINKSLNGRVVFSYDNNINTVNINKDVKITIIGPTKVTLQKLLKDFLKWISKNKQRYPLIEEGELFELFTLSYESNSKSYEGQVRKKKEINNGIDYKKKIKEILNEDVVKRKSSLTNSSSIAFILEFKNNKLILTGDSDIQTLKQSLLSNDIKEYDLIKIPHHGSKNNISQDLLTSIKCINYLICTDGSGRSKHPDLETLSYISSQKKANVYINYPIKEMSVPKDALEVLKKEYELKIFTDKNQGPLKLCLNQGEIYVKK